MWGKKSLRKALLGQQYEGKKKIQKVLEKSSSNLASQEEQDSLNESIKLGEPTSQSQVSKVEPEKNDDKDQDRGDSETSPSDDDDDDDGQYLDLKLPITSHVSWKGHEKAVTSISLDPPGTRLVSAGDDFHLKLYDVVNMDSKCRPFRSVEPSPGHRVHTASWSPNGEFLLVGAYTMQPIMLNRDGLKRQEFLKGDPYLKDLRRTGGHIGTVTSVSWNPNDKTMFVSAGQDGTLRIWNSSYRLKAQQVIVYASGEGVKAGNLRPDISKVEWTKQNGIVASSTDGSIKIWDSRNSRNALTLDIPDITIREAHQPGCSTTWISGKEFETGSLCSRSTDNTIKLWDLRGTTTKPVSTATVPAVHGMSSACFNPSGGLLVAPIDAAQSEMSRLLFLDSDTLKVVKTWEVPEASLGSCVAVSWHRKINQLACGMSRGHTLMLYDDEMSKGGAKIFAEKQPKKKTIEESLQEDLMEAKPSLIINPHALPMFRNGNASSARTGAETAAVAAVSSTKMTKRKLERIRKDPALSRIPERPVSGRGHGGRIGASSVQQIVLRDKVKDTTREEDPREAILKYAKAAEENPQWIAPAYQQTAPKPIYASKVYEDHEIDQNSEDEQDGSEGDLEEEEELPFSSLKKRKLEG